MVDHHQLWFGPTRTGMMDSRRFTPYGTCGAHPIVYGTVEVELPFQIPLPVLYGTPSATQPTGGTPETTANAETKQTTTEEEESSVGGSYCSPIPHVVDRLPDVRCHTPGTPAAKGYHASTASGPRGVPADYGRGLKPREGIGASRATRMQVLVSIYPAS